MWSNDIYSSEKNTSPELSKNLIKIRLFLELIFAQTRAQKSSNNFTLYFQKISQISAGTGLRKTRAQFQVDDNSAR